MFSKFFIYRPIFAMVISIVLVLLGGISIPILPIESMPDITPPTVKVSAVFPGASASVVEQTVAQPIEQQVNGVENMIYMSSASTAAGTMDLTVTFEIGTDIDMATVLTQNLVSIAEPLLPEEVTRQGVSTKKQSTNMVLMVGLFSPDDRYDGLYLSNYATTRIIDVLARVDGVGEVTNFGAKDFSMRIWLEPNKLRSRGLTTDEVVAALREQNVQVAAGKVGQPPNPAGLNFEYNINTLGRLETVEQFENIVIKVGEAGELVRVKDIARTELGSQDYSWYIEMNGSQSAGLGIYQLPGANALGVKQGIEDAMAELAEDFPSGLEWNIPYDSTEYIEASIAEVIETLFIAILLVILSVYIFLQDWRTTLIPAITIPVSLIATFSVLLALGMSINTLTLFGIVLAIGIVVDDSIVVVENTMRIINEEGLSAKEATAKSMEEISGAVVATTMVLLAVFVPTIMMPGLTGQLYSQFAITISVAVIFSSLNALTLAPALCGMLLRPSRTEYGRFFTWFNSMFARNTERYTSTVSLLLRRVGFSLAIFGVLLVATLFGITSLPGGFLPDEDQGYFYVNVELPDGASADRTREVLDHVSTLVDELPHIRDYLTVGGFSFLNAVQGSNYGGMIVTLVPWDERPAGSMRAIIGQLQAGLNEIQEAISFSFLPPPISGLGNASGFSMELQNTGGFSYQQLQTFADDLVADGNQSPVVTRLNQNFTADVPQLFTDVDRERVKAYGVPLQSVFNTLQTNLGSSYVNDFNAFGRTWKVYVQADQEYRALPEDILRLEVRNKDGAMIPISTLATVRDTVGPQVINRFNMFQSASITGAPSPGYSTGQATAEMERISAQRLPRGMNTAWSGITFQEMAAGDVAALIFAMAIVLAFLFLAAQYESWAMPVAVLMSVPLAILGAALFTGMRGLDNNIYMQIGLVLLIGLSAKTAILIVEFAKQLREEGLSPFDAAVKAARLRFRPILMTAVSFILGVIPLVIASGAGAASRVSLGTAVMGGMIMATVLGVFAIPMLYLLAQRASDRFSGQQAAVSSEQTTGSGQESADGSQGAPSDER